jgi:cytochrome c
LTSFSASRIKPPYFTIGKASNIKYQSLDGEKLITRDQIGCHKIDKKISGPSYLEIAKKISFE